MCVDITSQPVACSPCTASPTPQPSSPGMAGSGKTTLLQRINSHLHSKNVPGYIINLDPAVTHVPYGANIDIRDTVRRAGEAARQRRARSSKPEASCLGGGGGCAAGGGRPAVRCFFSAAP